MLTVVLRGAKDGVVMCTLIHTCFSPWTRRCGGTTRYAYDEGADPVSDDITTREFERGRVGRSVTAAVKVYTIRAERTRSERSRKMAEK